MLRVVRARWVIVAVCLALATTAGWLSAPSAGPRRDTSTTQYRATTTLISTGVTSTIGAGSAGFLSLTAIAAFASSTSVAALVAEQIGGVGDPAELSAAIEATADVQSGVVNITATADDRQRAKLLADSFAEALILHLDERKARSARTQAKATNRELNALSEEVSELNAEIVKVGEDTPEAEILIREREGLLQLYQQLSTTHRSLLISAGDPAGVSVLDEASVTQVSTGGFQPPRSRLARTALGGLFGLLVGLGLALLIERVRARVRTREEAEESGLPVLADIPHIRRPLRQHLAVAKEPRSAVAEAFRLLDSSLTRWSDPTGERRDPRRKSRARPKTILVTSAGPGDGKSTVVANLAAACAEVGRRVAVLSCDLHQPGLRRFFDGAGSDDLAHVLVTGEVAGLFAGNGNIVSTPNGEIRVVDSSPVPGRSRELLSSEAMRRVLIEARSNADVVLIDSAPLVTAGDVAPLLGEADAVLLVTRVGKTSVKGARRAGELLELLQAPALGVVLNGVKGASFPRGYVRPERHRQVGDARAERAARGDDEGVETVKPIGGPAGHESSLRAPEDDEAHVPEGDGKQGVEGGFSPTTTSSDR